MQVRMVGAGLSIAPPSQPGGHIPARTHGLEARTALQHLTNRSPRSLVDMRGQRTGNTFGPRAKRDRASKYGTYR